MKSFLYTFVFVLTYLTCASGFSNNVIDHNDYRNFSAYAKDSILYDSSDIQGLMAASLIKLKDFGHMNDQELSVGVPRSTYGIYADQLKVKKAFLKRAAYASQSIEIKDTGFNGKFNTPKLTGNNGGYNTIPWYNRPLNNPLEISSAWENMILDTLNIAQASYPVQLYPTMTASSGPRLLASSNCEQNNAVYYYQIDKLINMRIENNCSNNKKPYFVFIVKGKDIDFIALNIEISRNIKPEQILFVFPEARNLKLQASGSSFIQPTIHTTYGVPGSFLAPFANLEFKNGLVTGALYAKNIWASPECGVMNGPGGQVNFSLFTGWDLIARPKEPNCCH